MKLSFCTKGSMRVLNTWATSGPAGIGLDLDLLAVGLGGLAHDLVGRDAADGHGVHEFGEPHARLGRHADDRDQAPLGDRLDDQARKLLLGRRGPLEIRAP